MNFPTPVTRNSRSSGRTLFKGCWILLLLNFGLGMGYLRIQSQVMDASWKSKSLEIKLLLLDDHVTALQVKLARLKDPATIKSRLEEKKIDLVTPKPEQVVRVSQMVEPPPEVAGPSAPTGDLVFVKARR